MGKKSPHYVTFKSKGKPFVFSVSHIVYRDKQGRFAKFHSRRKLRVEVYARSEAYSKKSGRTVQKIRRIKKYSLGFAKRKKPITLESVKKRALKKVLQNQGELVKIDGLWKFRYAGDLPKKRKVTKIKKGLLHEYYKTFESSLSGNSGV